MKIKIITSLPVDLKHGLGEGQIHEVVKDESHLDSRHHTSGMWVIGETGDPVKILNREYEIVEE